MLSNLFLSILALYGVIGEMSHVFLWFYLTLSVLQCKTSVIWLHFSVDLKDGCLVDVYWPKSKDYL